MKFMTEADAVAYFDSYDVEECDSCGEFSMSLADHDEGEIVSCDPDHGFDRICLGCDEELD